MITAKVEGGYLATKSFKNIIKDVNDRKTMVKEVLLPAAKIVKKVMIGMAPILTGASSFNVYRDGKVYVKIKPGQLKKSISYFHTPSTREAGAINIGPRYKSGVWKKPEKGGWFMHMVQFGTDSVKPQPFVLQALIATKSGVGNLMEIGMNKRLQKAIAKNGNGVIVK
tara:strand:+ start:656 stop:1159 length:504 start_codon:yes stop_codon:yes gene_type:complete